jgi:ATP/maltotriose-dependent transcriptional regulator MalT
VVTALVNTLAAQPNAVALLLDDYHLIQAPPVHDSLTLLLERLPPQLRLLLASRTDPPLPLARLRARGQLVELRAAELRFTTEETAALLREATGLELPADSDWAARLVEHHAQAHYERGEGATVDRWLTALPADLLRARPRLLVAQAIWALIGGRVDQVELLLQAAEHAFAAQGGEPAELPGGGAARGLANLPAMVAMLRAELARQHGDAEHTIQFARQGLALAAADDQYLRYFVGWNLAVGTLMQGRVEEAEAALGDLAADPWATGQHRYFAVRARYTLAQAQRAQGRLGAALRSCQQALELAAEPSGRPPLPAAGVAHVGLAEILYERGELDTALHHATEGVALSRQLAYAQWLVTGLTALAWIRQAQGDQADALAAIGEAEQTLPSPDAVSDLFFPVAVQRIRLLLANGEVAEGARWVGQRGLGATDKPSYGREREYLVLARVLLAEQAPEQALGLLRRLHKLAAAQTRVGSVIEIQALQALALAASGDERGALAALTQALLLAAPEGYLRVFVDEGAPMASLMGRLAAPNRQKLVTAGGTIPPDYLARLVASFPLAAAHTSQPAARTVAGSMPGLVEPLSKRELEVLALLATGRSNQQIADELVVALDTVKKHVGRVLDKLGAANRTQAVARARELELLR